MSGKLIVIEGSDGAGKATQTKLLVDRLKEEGKTVETMEFPRYTETFFGAYIREWLDGKHGDFVAIDPKLASVLYACDRWESLDTLNRWLEESAVVILDRYVSANMLHQGAKFEDKANRGAFLLWLEQLEHDVFKLPRPDRTIYLDIPTPLRHALLSTDETRTQLDMTETNMEHQNATERCARQISDLQDWYVLSCVRDDKLRGKEDIHEEVTRIALETINAE